MLISEAVSRAWTRRAIQAQGPWRPLTVARSAVTGIASIAPLSFTDIRQGHSGALPGQRTVAG
jgi:hypothetical protein